MKQTAYELIRTKGDYNIERGKNKDVCEDIGGYSPPLVLGQPGETPNHTSGKPYSIEFTLQEIQSGRVVLK